MLERGLEKMSDWLGVTKQQLLIMTTINKLCAENRPASPKNICAEFKEKHGAAIQKSNLFTQMKALLDRGFVAKEGKAEYTIVPELMKSDLLRKKNQIREEIVEIDELLDTLDNFFSDLSEGDSDQSVDYLRRTELFELLTLKLRHAKECYIVSKFPNIALTSPTYTKLGREDYVKTMQERCLVTRDMVLHVLTSPGIELPFETALRFYNNDADAAYRECDLTIKQLKNQVENYDNLDVRHLEHPFGFDVLIPVFQDVKEFFMFIRDEKDLITGGIHVKSRKTSKRAYERILIECKTSKAVKGEYTDVICKKLYEDLDQAYKSAKGGMPAGAKAK